MKKNVKTLKNVTLTIVNQSQLSKIKGGRISDGGLLGDGSCPDNPNGLGGTHYPPKTPLY